MGLKIHQHKQPHAGLWSGRMAGRREEQPQFGKLKNVLWPEPLTPDHFKLAGIRGREINYFMRRELPIEE